MISITTNLSDRIEELERIIEELKTNSSVSETSLNCVCINKNFSNLEITSERKIFIKTIKLLNSSSLVFQGEIILYLPTDEDVEISLLSSSTIIQKQTLTLTAGKNAISIFCNFSPILVEKVMIYLKITPKNNKTIYLQSVSLFVWGTVETTQDDRYQLLETDDNYHIFYLSSGTLYHLETEKVTGEYSLSDYSYAKSLSSFCFCQNTDEDKLFLFQVSDDENLFYGVFLENESFLLGSVTDVSAIYINSKFIVFCIINGCCYEFYIDNNGAVSNLKKIESFSKNLCRVYCYYNETIDKVFLLVSDENNSNYLVVQKSENEGGADNISVSYSILIETY